MSECPLHSYNAMDFICTTQNCQERGAICQLCIPQHRAHNIQDLNQFLNDNERILLLVQNDEIGQEEQLQNKVLIQLDNLKRDIFNVIAKLQIESKQAFTQELQIRKAQMSDQNRQAELISTLKTQKLGGGQFKQRILELLHRQQAKYPPSKLGRYQEVSRRIENHGSDILKTLQALLDVQERPLSNQDDQSQLSRAKAVSEAPSSRIIAEQHQYTEVKSRNHITEVSHSPPPMTSTTQTTRKTPEIRQDLNPIYSTPRPQQILTPFKDDGHSSTSSRKRLEQRDLEPVGTYSSIRSNYQRDISSSPISRPIQEYQQNSYTPTKYQPAPVQAKHSVQSSIKTPDARISQDYDNQDQDPKLTTSQFNVQPLKDNTQSQIELHSQIQQQQQRINQRHQHIEQSKGQFASAKLNVPSQDMNVSYISNRSTTPPPVKVTSNLQNPFQQNHFLSWRAHEKGVKCLAMMDQDKIISCGSDNKINIWDKTKSVLKMSLEGHDKPVLCVVFHQKRVIASGSADRTIKIWRPNPTWQLALNLLGHQDKVRCVQFISQSILASGSDDCTVRVWDLNQGGVCQFTLPTDNGRVSGIVNYFGQLVATAGKHILTWEKDTFKALKSIPAHENLVTSLVLQLDRTQKGILVTASKDFTIKLWEMPSITQVAKIKEDYAPSCLDIDPSTSYLVVAMLGFEGEGKISIWSLKHQNGITKVQEILSNPTGCNFVIVDRQSEYNKLIIYSAHENKKIDIHALTHD